MALTKVTGQVIKNTTDVTVGVLTVTNTLAVGGTVSVGGTLTYEDVTNVDSVGLITARNGIVVGGGITLSKDGDIFATGITTISGNVKVGTGITLSPDGDAFFTGVTTATKFVGANAEVSGDLSGATGTFTGDVRIADKIIHTGDTNTAIRFPEADTFSVETSGTQRLRAEAAGNVNFANNINVSGTSTVTGIAQFANTINLTHASAGQNYIYFNEDLQLAKNGTGTRLKINSSGSVGIGTVTVSGAKLDVIDGIINVGAAVTTNDSRIQFTRKDTGIYSWVGIPTWNPNAFYIYGPKDSSPYNEVAAVYESSVWTFYSNNNARLRINSNGSLNVHNTSGYDTYSVDISNAGATDTAVQIRPNDGNAGEARLFIGGGGSSQNKCAIIFDPTGGYCRGNLHFCTDNTADVSNVDSTDEKLTIRGSDGRVIVKNDLELDTGGNGGLFGKIVVTNQAYTANSNVDIALTTGNYIFSVRSGGVYHYNAIYMVTYYDSADKNSTEILHGDYGTTATHTVIHNGNNNGTFRLTFNRNFDGINVRQLKLS